LLLTLLLISTSAFADTKYIAEEVRIVTEEGIYRIPAGTAVEVTGNEVKYQGKLYQTDHLTLTTAEGAKVITEEATRVEAKKHAKQEQDKKVAMKKRLRELDKMRGTADVTKMTLEQMRAFESNLNEMDSLLKQLSPLEVQSAIFDVPEEYILKVAKAKRDEENELKDAELKFWKQMNKNTDKMSDILDQITKRSNRRD